MSRRIALVEHQRPRILTVDFSDADAAKIRNLGFNVRAGYTSREHEDKFCIPWAVEDVEILFARVSPGSFSGVSDRPANGSSVETSPRFKALLLELWLRRGWAVLFIEQDCSPREFDALGIKYVGALSYNQQFFPARDYNHLLATIDKDFNKAAKQVDYLIPRFKGEAVFINAEETEAKVLERHLQSAKYSVLAIDRQIELVDIGNYQRLTFLVEGASATRNALAMKLSWGNTGTILFLPDFGKKNVDVAISLLQNVIQDKSPSLFDSPDHPWLSDYLPAPVQVIRQNKEEIVELAKKRLAELQKSEEETLEKFNWLLGLLTGTGDEFRDHAAAALRFLGFRVEIIDDEVPPGTPLKEDLHVFDDAVGYFALGETKATKRGATEDMISDIQNHQGRYSREHKVPIPDGLLIINHSYGFDPAQRAGRFYTNANVVSRCTSNAITAIDSVALFRMCQSVLSGEVNVEALRRYLINDFRVISSFNVSDLAE